MLNPNHQIQEVFIHDQGHEIAMFLEKYIRANNLPLPRVSDVHGEGKVLSGVVLTAWSMGNAILTSTLANAVSLSEDTRTLLDQYLRSVVLYGTYDLITAGRLLTWVQVTFRCVCS